MMNNTYVGIMAGGAGTRFWPASREDRPKQFLDILGVGKTLLQMTYERFLKVCPKENIFIISNEKYSALIKQQLPDLEDHQILEEPVRRNTAPCVAYAAHKIHALNENANIVVAPADHFIQNEETFIAIISKALTHAQNIENSLLTLGIRPTRPDTGYGYIQMGEQEGKESNLHLVKTFTEKPDLEIAQTFLASGDFVWNSGIFIWNAKSILNAYETYLPEMNEIFVEGKDKYNTSEEKAFVKEAYPLSKNISIDYGIMEKAEKVLVIPGDFGWSDLGTWGSVYDKLMKDDKENVIIGKNVMTFDTSNSIVNVPHDKLVILDGLDDYIIVESDDILLVTPKSKEQNIKQLLTKIRQSKGDEYM
jgi:mannose-1-phosphate guanylyltransferase